MRLVVSMLILNPVQWSLRVGTLLRFSTFMISSPNAAEGKKGRAVAMLLFYSGIRSGERADLNVYTEGVRSSSLLPPNSFRDRYQFWAMPGLCFGENFRKKWTTVFGVGAG